MAEAAGRQIAAELVRRIRARCLMLAETPGEIGTARPELVEGIRTFPTSPYVLFFRYREDEVQIVRILHERQDVERHLA